MTPNAQLSTFIAPYSREIQDLLFDLREVILSACPDVNELIWDNYNAVAIAYSKSLKLSDAFCHLAVYSKHINFGFNRGAELESHSLKLEGKGKLIRHLKVKSILDIQKEDVGKLVKQAMKKSLAINQELENGKSTKVSKVMSISEKKIRP